jgi:hypothetical protein
LSLSLGNPSRIITKLETGTALVNGRMRKKEERKRRGHPIVESTVNAI